MNKGEISSFVGFIKAFLKQWDPSYEEPLMHDIANLGAMHGDDEMQLHEDIAADIIMDSKEDKGLVSMPFQICESNHQRLHDFNMVEREEFANASTSPIDRQHGSQEKDDVDALLVIGRNR